MHLLVADIPLSELVQTGGVLAVLAFFTWYFMKEQKELRGKMDAQQERHEVDMKDLRKTYDDKVDTLYKRQEEIQQRTLIAMSESRDSSEKLASAVEALTAQLKRT